MRNLLWRSWGGTDGLAPLPSLTAPDTFPGRLPASDCTPGRASPSVAISTVTASGQIRRGRQPSLPDGRRGVPASNTPSSADLVTLPERDDADCRATDCRWWRATPRHPAHPTCASLCIGNKLRLMARFHGAIHIPPSTLMVCPVM